VAGCGCGWLSLWLCFVGNCGWLWLSLAVAVAGFFGHFFAISGSQKGAFST
jgi:hypothetical protein